MTENDLCENLAIRICDISNGKEWDVTLAEEHKERHREIVQEEFLPLIRSYANALVAATVSECAKHIPHIYYDEQGGYLGCECGWKTYSRIVWAEHLSAVTPESAAKELERIKAQARLEEHDLHCPYCRCCDGCRKLCRRRSALEAAKEK